MSNTETWDEERLRASIANREEVIADLRAEKRRADTLGSISRHVDAESCDRDVLLDVLLDAIGDAYDAARREGAEAMRNAAAKACEGDRTAFVAAFVVENGRPPTERELAPFIIRSLPLPTVSQTAQRPAASETPEAPLTVADATARSPLRRAGVWL